MIFVIISEMIEQGGSLVPESNLQLNEVVILSAEAQREIRETKNRPKCESCGENAVFHVNYADDSGGFDCLKHGPNLTNDSLDFRISQIKGMRPNHIFGNSICQIKHDGQWIPLNWLTLKPKKSQEEFLPNLSPHQKSLYTLITLSLNNEIAIEQEKFHRRATHTERPFRSDEDPLKIQQWRRICSLIRDKHLRMLEEEDGIYRTTFGKSLGNVHEEDRILYEIVAKESGDFELSFEEYYRLSDEDVKSFLDMDPDLKERYEKERGVMRNLLQEALRQGMENIDLIQIMAVAHELLISNDDIRRWANIK